MAKKQDGPFEERYDNGQLREEGTLKDGVRHGLCRSYYESGELESERNWEKGSRSGPYEYYAKDGRVTGKGTFYRSSPPGPSPSPPKRTSNPVPPKRTSNPPPRSRPGFCDLCGKAIERGRLDVIPDTNLCSTCARADPSDDEDPKQDKCPRCGGVLVMRTPREGLTKYFRGCSNYPRCRYTD